MIRLRVYSYLKDPIQNVHTYYIEHMGASMQDLA